MGVAAGAGVLVSRFFGARKLEELHIAVHTFVAFTFLFGVLMMVAGITLTPLFLQWMGTPADIMEMAVLYLRIYFLGIIPTMLYNSGAGILQAVGDSRRPLCFLTIASVLNIILDLVFVIQEHGRGRGGLGDADRADGVLHSGGGHAAAVKGKLPDHPEENPD